MRAVTILAAPSRRLLDVAARPCRHAVGDRWYIDETYVKIAGSWRYVNRAVDQCGQIIDVYVSRVAVEQCVELVGDVLILERDRMGVMPQCG